MVCPPEGHPEMSTQHVVTLQIKDVNDNKPLLTKNHADLCVKTLDPVIIEAEDPDGDPYGEPFTFTLEKQPKYPNWKLDTVSGTDGIVL